MKSKTQLFQLETVSNGVCLGNILFCFEKKLKTVGSIFMTMQRNINMKIKKKLMKIHLILIDSAKDIQI